MKLKNRKIWFKLIPALFIVQLLLASCAFNSLFYYPDTDPVSPATEGEDIYLSWNEKDTFHGIFYPAEKAIASIYLLHGNAGNLEGWKGTAKIFRKAGYNVFIIDYPGFGNSDGKPRHNSVIRAAQVGLDYFVGRAEVAPTKKIILGMSLGGNLAVKTGTDNQDKIDAMVLEGPFSSHRTVGMTHVAKPLRPIAFYMVRNRIKGEHIIKKWKKPLLIIHSAEDQVCLYKMGKVLYEKSPSEHKELWTIEGKHLQGLNLHREEYLKKVKQLITY